MKRVILLAVVFLSGCVTTPMTYEQQQMEYMQMQQTLQLMNAMQPRTAPRSQMPQMQQFTPPPSGLTYVLVEQAVNGVNRYCKYANGTIVTVHVTQLCQQSVVR